MAGQNAGGATIWLTGLSGSGKSTIARALFDTLSQRHAHPYLLDGDELREGLNTDLGFSACDRAENVRRIGEVALLFARAGHVCLAPVISPYAADRAAVRRRHEETGVPFVEVYIATSLAVCERRDTKGLYARARAGELADFTGISDPYEPPQTPDVACDTDGRTPIESALEVFSGLEHFGAGRLVGALGTH